MNKRNNFILPRIAGFSQNKLIENELNSDQAHILCTIQTLINNNTSKNGEEIHKTLIVDDVVYYDIAQYEILDALPILNRKHKNNMYRDLLMPLITKGFIIKYPIKTKFLIRLNKIDELL